MESVVKPLIVLIIFAGAAFAAPSMSMAADRDAADRQTRQESDELRADMRQQRLKKVRELDNPGPQQPATEKPKASGPGN
jgi:hypothetical protein